MLSEVLEAWAPSLQKSTRRAPGLSISALFPCPYRLYMVHTGEFTRQRGKWTPQQILNADDGWSQESQSVERLAKAGIKIIDRQMRVSVGASQIPGSIDGAFIAKGKKRLWEHKAYDQGSDAVKTLQLWGLDRLPNQKAQSNGYMLGARLDEVDFFVKVKNNNDYIDRVYPIDLPFITEIVDWCDRIRLDAWAPEPKECQWCSYCGFGCFDPVLDFSWMSEVSEEEMVEKWKKGDQFKKIGEMLLDDARTYFVGKKDKHGNVLSEGIIGDRDLLLAGDLEVKKVMQHRFNIKKDLVVQEFGVEGLFKVAEESDIATYRIGLRKGGKDV